MARVLVTGADGFAGRHLIAACSASGDEVTGLSRRTGGRVDLLDFEAARGAVAAARPQVVHHLAARSHVGRSWREPRETVSENVATTHNVLEAVRLEAPEAVVLLASSGEVYGPRAGADETAPLSPLTPYAASKAACDLLAGFHAEAHGMRVIRARAFNHAGPGQPATYAIASFARQVAEGLEAGAGTIEVVTGRPDTRRDYTDVRDVVAAYRALAERGEAGVWNVCSGVARSSAELVEALRRVTGADVVQRVDPALVRPNEVLEISGSPARLREATGWVPRIPLEQTLADAVAFWRGELRAGRAGTQRHE